MNGDPRHRRRSTPLDVLAFWRAAGPDKWFNKDAAFDAEIAARFGDALARGCRGQACTLGGDAGGRARARHRARSVPSQHVPRASARLRGGCRCPRRRRSRHQARVRPADSAAGAPLLLLPFMHSENLADQERCMELARAYGDDEFMKYAELHADIVRRFGRFPHRNAMLGPRDDAGGAGLSRRRRLRRLRIVRAADAHLRRTSAARRYALHCGSV